MLKIEHPARVSYGALAFFCLLFPLIILVSYVYTCMHGMAWGTDFSIYFATAQTLYHGSWAIYDQAALERYLHRLTPKIEGVHFPYTPAVALLIAPLGRLSASEAYWAWTAAGMALFAVAQATALKQFYPQWDARFRIGVSLITTVLSPFTVFNIVPGQSGFFSSAGLVAAMAWAMPSPWRAGASLAFAALISPRMAYIGAVVLLCGRCWKALAWTSAMGVLMVIATIFVCGLQPWLDWFHYLGAFSQLFAMNPHWLQQLTCSFFVMLRLLGMPSIAVVAAWSILAALIIKTALRIIYRARGIAAWPLVMVGAALLLPYAMWYDMVCLNLPLIWLLNRINKTGFYAGELGWLCLAVTMPILAILDVNEFVNLSPMALIILYALLVRRFSADNQLIA